MNRAEIDELLKKNIGKITLFAGLLGLVPLLLSMMPFGLNGLLGELYIWLNAAKPFVSFDFHAIDNLGQFYYLNQMGYLYLPLIFYGVMLAGYFSLKNESPIAYRLIRFVFSVIFISQIIGFVWMVLGVFTDDYIYGLSIYWVVVLLLKVAWAYIAFSLLRTDLKPVDEFGAISNDKQSSLIEAPKGKRFLHHIIDSLIYTGTCTGIIMFYSGSFIGGWYFSAGSNITYLIIAVMARLIYYPMFETLFGATPGKFLTGSKVVKEDGSKITFDQSWVRTFIRLVPFEPFSFLGKNKGWHDSWSKTKVVFTDESESFGMGDDVIDDF